MQFNEQLSALRRAKGISQEALAEQLNVSRQAVSKWETGTAKPELDNILALCRILEVSPNELLGEPTTMDHTPPALPDTDADLSATSTKTRSPLRMILLYCLGLFLLILLALGFRNTMDRGTAPKFESCRIYETRVLDSGREFTLEINYAYVPENQSNEIYLTFSPLHINDPNLYPLSITMNGNVGYVTFLVPYDAECTVQHISMAKRMHYLRDIFKITSCTKGDYQTESLVK